MIIPLDQLKDMLDCLVSGDLDDFEHSYGELWNAILADILHTSPALVQYLQEPAAFPHDDCRNTN
ncbi:hypothetical protein [Paenibacillus sp. GP183]|uniref:hypothetical protein n=1 Tax=Paenibacillus sp. GP183 TaxID=1882751 RepID=UPI000B8A565A|nr:hypothetical protein [Paenibacillus sp. GP183]